MVLNEEDSPVRNTWAHVPGYRAIDPTQTNPLASDFLVPNMPTYNFTNPDTGESLVAQNNRLGMDYGEFDGFRNAASMMNGFGVTSDASAAILNNCVFTGEIGGDDLCASTSGLNREEFEANTTQLNLTYQLTDDIELKYIFGHNELMYRRTTDDDNTNSPVIDRQFYVNHEAAYESHELVAFMDFSDNFTVTSGIFFYDAQIDQRGDFYSSVGEARFQNPYVDNTALGAGLDSVLSNTLGAGEALTPLFTGISIYNMMAALESRFLVRLLCTPREILV